MIPDPDADRRRLAKAGREWFAQRFLACLLLGEPPARMNTPYPPNGPGLRLLAALDPWHEQRDDAPTVFWEFRLDALEPDQPNRWPDLAVRWPDRLLLLELKTEAGSVRDKQVDEYLQLGLHHHPDIRVDLLFLTRDRVPAIPAGLPERARYGTRTWSELAPLIRDAWSHDDSVDGTRARRFSDWIDEGMPRAEVPVSIDEELVGEVPVSTPAPAAAVTSAEPADPVAAALALAALVEEDMQQRGVDAPVSTRDAAVDLRDAILDALAATDAVHVRPWIWRLASTGAALTDAGRQHGIEVRLSYYR